MIDLDKQLVIKGDIYLTNKKILVVEDEVKILEVVTSLLQSRGYQALQATDGKEALMLFEQENISLVLLDLMLPDMSGEEICRKIRAKSRVPIIMLTAKVEEEHLLKGLQMGADDYITKPFSLKELAARVEVVLRRTTDELKPLYQSIYFENGELSINVEGNMVRKQGRQINLTKSEWKLLLAFIKYPNKVFTREELIQIVLGEEYEGYNRTIDSHIKNLRQKIEDVPRNPVYIITVHGKGYKFGGV